MLGLQRERRLRVIAEPPATRNADLAVSVRAGLSASPKRLAFRFLYDDRGSRLFEEICCQPEYYLTRAEAEILHAHADAILDAVPDLAAVVELGSGNAEKTRILLAALHRRGRAHYVPIDISRGILEASSQQLLHDFPRLEVTAIAADYHAGLRLAADQAHPQLVLWLGSNIGNLTRPQASQFLRRLRATLEPGDRLLVGIDTCRDAKVLERAYDDRAGKTADFNLNLLERINRELAADFDLEGFAHRAVYDEEWDRVELSLVAREAQEVHVRALDLAVHFAAGEAMHTEWSHKYGPRDIETLCRESGFGLQKQWLDGQRRYSLNLLHPLLAG